MSTPGSPPAKPYRRRSARIPRRLKVLLRWRDLAGNPKEEPAETLNLSRHGCMVACRSPHRLGEEVSINWPEAKREARARIVWREMGGPDVPVRLGLEFADVEEFWGIEFPADLSTGSPFMR